MAIRIRVPFANFTSAALYSSGYLSATMFLSALQWNIAYVRMRSFNRPNTFEDCVQVTFHVNHHHRRVVDFLFNVGIARLTQLMAVDQHLVRLLESAQAEKECVEGRNTLNKPLLLHVNDLPNAVVVDLR